jgi:Rps23 Pro-64 3,4-dihydroxylase Tpa1-like proline 4-hydroxylase
VTFSLPSKRLAAVSEHAKHDRLTVQDWLRRVVEEKIAIK